MANNDPRTDQLPAPALGDRGLFPRLGAASYLTYGGIAALSAPVVAAAQAWMDAFASEGAAAFPAWAAQQDRLRRDLASLIGARQDDIAFVSNTMHGVNAIAFALPWQRGDRAVVIEGEYPTNVVPWQRASALFDLELLRIPVAEFASQPVAWNAFDRALEKKPRVIAVSAVQFQSGLRMPLKEISERCRAAGAQLFVDGVQACGAVPIDVMAEGIDYLACGSHKWLMGMQGAGFLYVNPNHVDALRPMFTGAMSYEGATDMLFAGPGHLRYDRKLRSDARVFEGGMLGGAALAGLGASVGLIRELGVARIFEHVQRFHDAIEPALIDRGFESLRHADSQRRSCILSFVPPRNVSAPQLCTLLRDQRVIASSPDGVFRVAPHWPNALAEIPVVIEAIDACLARLRK